MLQWIVSHLPPFFFALAAATSFSFAIFQVVKKNNAGAAILAALFLVCVLLGNLQNIRIFSAFGVEVRLRNTLNRAEEIINSLKQLSIISAKTSYFTMAWSNRLGGAPLAEKQNIMDQTDQELVALHFSHQQISQIQKPYVQMVGFDLFTFYYSLFKEFLRLEYDNLRTQDPIAAAPFIKRLNEWQKRTNLINTPTSVSDDLGVALSRVTPSNLLSTEQVYQAKILQKRILFIWKGCLKKGGYTKYAINLLHLNYEKEAAKIFGAPSKSHK